MIAKIEEYIYYICPETGEIRLLDSIEQGYVLLGGEKLPERDFEENWEWLCAYSEPIENKHSRRVK